MTTRYRSGSSIAAHRRSCRRHQVPRPNPSRCVSSTATPSRALSVALDPPVSLKDVVAALADPPAVGGVALRTAVGDPSIVGQVRLVAGTAEVDLLSAISALAGDEQLLAVAELVCTLTGRPGVGRVSFTLNGAPVDVPRGDGSLTARPVSRDDYRVLLGK